MHDVASGDPPRRPSGGGRGFIVFAGGVALSRKAGDCPTVAASGPGGLVCSFWLPSALFGGLGGCVRRGGAVLAAGRRLATHAIADLRAAGRIRSVGLPDSNAAT